MNEKKSVKVSRHKKPVWVIILLSFLVLLLFLSSGTYIYLLSTLNKIKRPGDIEVVLPEDEFFETDDDDMTETDIEVVEPTDVEWPVDEDIMEDKDIVNILLIGQDRRPGERRARSDSMMLVTINKKNKTLKVTSLMRDMYVQIPGYSDNRINASYAFGGMELLDKTINKNFLIKVDGNIEVDFDGFLEAIDSVGGVDIEVNAKEAAHLRNQGFSNVNEGLMHMDGKLALAYSRIRRIGNADYERTERQRRVVTALFNKTKDLNFSEITKLINVIFPCVTTDMTNNEIISLAFNIFLMKPEKIETYRIPVEESYKSVYIRKMAVLVPDLEKNRKALKDIIYN